MADIKVRDLTDTSSITLDDQVMILTNDEQNQVQNVKVSDLLTNVLSTNNGNVLEKGTDGKLYVETPETLTGDLANLLTTDKTTLVNAINETINDIETETLNRTNADNTLQSNINAEATTRQNADNNLQSQIDAITAASDVTDIVGTYAELQAYDTTGLPDNSIIKVLQDESRQNETTYYRWVITGGVGAWVLIGEEGPYYTISQTDSKFATNATVGNLSNLDTSDKSSIVNAMNELTSVLDPTQTADYIKNSKAIYSGEVSENSLILPQIKEMSHSTFDLSKFTVVGSPNITDEASLTPGILSGLATTEDYIKTPVKTSQLLNKSWEIRVPVNGNGAGWNAPINFGGYTYGNICSNVVTRFSQDNFYLNLRTGDTTESYQLTYSDTYKFNIATVKSQNCIVVLSFDINTGTYSFYIIREDGTRTNTITYTPTTTNKQLYEITSQDNYICIGGIRAGFSNDKATYDLKNYQIIVDGVEIFNGTKTGIDVIKPLNFVAQGCLYAYKYDNNTIYTNSGQDSTILYNSDGSFYTGSEWTISEGNVYYNGNQATYIPSADITLRTQNGFVDWNESKISDDGILSGSRYPVYPYRIWSSVDSIYFPDFDPNTLRGKSWTISVPFNFNGNKQNFQRLLGMAQPTQTFGYMDTQAGITVDYTQLYLTIPTGSGSDKAKNYNCVYISGNSLTNYLYEDLIISLSFDIQTGTYTMKLTDKNGVVHSQNWIKTYTPPTEDKELQIINGTVANGKLGCAAFYGMSIDLNGIKVVADGDLVFQPCLKIPYTKSKTGSKIVGVNYRSRVVDMYNQFGYAPYYTLSDSDFTLPMGELYGMIGRLDKLLNNEIGLPVPTLSNTLNDNEIWLEGAEVSKSTYWKLYQIYGDTYGTPDNADNFVLPDLRNRVLWGADNFGYISAGLPNITGSVCGGSDHGATGAFYWDSNSGGGQEGGGYAEARYNFNASRSSSIYGNSSTVQPPAIKVRFKTRYC